MATEPDATTQPTLATAVAEVGTAVERHSILWLTNVSHAVNHFQNQMVAVLYVAVMPELGFGPAQLGLLTAGLQHGGRLNPGPVRLCDALYETHLDSGYWQPGYGSGHSGLGFRRFLSALLSAPGVWRQSGRARSTRWATVLLSGYFPVNRGTIIALNSSASNVGSLLAPLVAAAMLLIMGWREVFMIVAFLSIGIGPGLLSIPKSRGPDQRPCGGGPNDPGEVAAKPGQLPAGVQKQEHDPGVAGHDGGRRGPGRRCQRGVPGGTPWSRRTTIWA